MPTFRCRMCGCVVDGQFVSHRNADHTDIYFCEGCSRMWIGPCRVCNTQVHVMNAGSRYPDPAARASGLQMFLCPEHVHEAMNCGNCGYVHLASDIDEDGICTTCRQSSSFMSTRIRHAGAKPT